MESGKVKVEGLLELLFLSLLILRIDVLIDNANIRLDIRIAEALTESTLTDLGVSIGMLVGIAAFPIPERRGEPASLFKGIPVLILSTLVDDCGCDAFLC